MNWVRSVKSSFRLLGRPSNAAQPLSWGPEGGKRGGLRVIYLWHEPTRTFFMLFAYQKSVQDDLTPGQLRALRRIVEEQFR
jgi:hypothetical protein